MILKYFLRFIAVVMMFGIIFNAEAKTESLTIEGDHGKLSAILQTPDGLKNYPLVIILHGFAADKEMFLLKQIANSLETKGIASLQFDFNGHGESEGLFEDMTVLNEIEDTKKVYEYARKLPEITSVSMVGHSQGGVITGMIAGELGADKIKSIVLLAPAAVLRDNALAGHIFGLKYDLDNLPEYVMLNEKIKVGRKYLDTTRYLPIYETSEKYTGPVYIVHGTDDELVPYSYSERYDKIYANSKLEILEGFDHNFNQDIMRVVNLVSDYFADVNK